MEVPAPNAPEITIEYGWLNSDKNYSIKDFRRKVVLHNFWTFGCINCQNIIADLEKLEKEYPAQLAIIWVHSEKFYRKNQKGSGIKDASFTKIELAQ